MWTESEHHKIFFSAFGKGQGMVIDGWSIAPESPLPVFEEGFVVLVGNAEMAWICEDTAKGSTKARGLLRVKSNHGEVFMILMDNEKTEGTLYANEGHLVCCPLEFRGDYYGAKIEGKASIRISESGEICVWLQIHKEDGNRLMGSLFFCWYKYEYFHVPPADIFRVKINLK